MDASGAGPASRSQLPGWVRGGLTGLAAAKGILYRDINTPIPESRGRVERREERTKRELLEESLLLLRQHHKETLEQLHSEAERLQRENRELSFRLIMCRCGLRDSDPNSSTTDNKGEYSADTLHVLGLEKEVHQLRQALAEKSHRNARILQLLQDQQQTVVTENGEEDSQLLLRRDEAKLHVTKMGLHQWVPNSGLEVRANHCQQETLGKRQLGNNTIKLPALRPRLAGGVAERERRRQAVRKRVSRTRLPPLQPLT